MKLKQYKNWCLKNTIMNELQLIQSKIYEIRGQKVMLDFDLAEMYEVETRVLNQAVKRNIRRFPDDFMFQLTVSEWDTLKSQFVISRRGGTRKLPFAFTEGGLTMLSGVLNSDIAIQVNINIMRAFCRHSSTDSQSAGRQGRGVGEADEGLHGRSIC